MSERVVFPYTFTLQAAVRQDAYRSGAVKQVIAALDGKAGTISADFVPAALRWLTIPGLGIPRQPFQVFRRQRLPLPSGVVRTLVKGPGPLTGPAVDLPFPLPDFNLAYLVAIDAAPSPGQWITITAYDLFGRAIPGQQYTLPGPARLLACPGMAGLRVTGIGSVSQVLGVTGNDYANLTDWRLIQVVGLPVRRGETGSSYDSNAAQGYEPAALDGYDAALQRLLIAGLLRGTPPPTGNAAVPLPAWPATSPAGYLDDLGSAGQLLPMIIDCLAGSVDSDPNRMQAAYAQAATVDGIRQDNLPGAAASEPSSVSLPVVNTALLAVSAESDAATALGYGTIDLGTPGIVVKPAALPRATVGAVAADNQYDYMVTASFQLPVAGLAFTLAALSQDAAAAVPPAGLSVSGPTGQAVLGRDAAAHVTATLGWQPAAVPQGYAVLASRQPGSAAFLNTSRPGNAGGYDPYIGVAPAVPGPGSPPDQQGPQFPDSAGQLPVDGTAATTYLVAGIDVFGQWSSWSQAQLPLAAAPITQPGVKSASLQPGPLPATGAAVPATLVVDLLWDWTDRCPGTIRITGQFIPAGSALGPAYLAGLALGNTVPATAPLLLAWDYTGQDPVTVVPSALLPVVTSGQQATVELLTDSTGVASGQVMQYRVTVRGLTLDFSTADELDLAVYVTATERIRPGEWSDPVLTTQQGPNVAYTGQVARALNPFPPALDFAPPAISWTALPDALGVARGMLEWTATPSATGYFVWESTEGALLQLLSPDAADPDPAASLVARGATLKALVAAHPVQAMQSFSRLNTDPIAGTRTEIELPGSASGLYAYMISAVSSQGVEAQRGPDIAVFAVPQRLAPRQPRLILRQQPLGQSGIQVVALPVETGVVPAGYQVLRVRSATLAQDAALMGPPKIGGADPGWQPYTDTPVRGGTTATGRSVLDAAATPSWYPYYYRVVAVGPDDPANGEYSGQSPPSGVQSAYCLPAAAPAFAAQPLAQGFAAALLVATVDLPIPPSPLAPSLVELLSAAPDPDHPGRTIQRSLLSVAPDLISVGVLTLPRWILTTTPGHPPGGHGPVVPFRGPAFARSAPDPVTRTWTLYVLAPYAMADVGTYTVRLTDPLGRQTPFTF